MFIRKIQNTYSVFLKCHTAFISDTSNREFTPDFLRFLETTPRAVNSFFPQSCEQNIDSVSFCSKKLEPCAFSLHFYEPFLYFFLLSFIKCSTHNFGCANQLKSYNLIFSQFSRTFVFFFLNSLYFHEPFCKKQLCASINISSYSPEFCEPLKKSPCFRELFTPHSCSIFNKL